MNRGLSRLDRWILGTFDLALLAYPASFRARYGKEMRELAADSLAEAEATGFARARMGAALVADAAGAAARQHVHQFEQAGLARIHMLLGLLALCIALLTVSPTLGRAIVDLADQHQGIPARWQAATWEDITSQLRLRADAMTASANPWRRVTGHLVMLQLGREFGRDSEATEVLRRDAAGAARALMAHPESTVVHAAIDLCVASGSCDPRDGIERLRAMDSGNAATWLLVAAFAEDRAETEQALAMAADARHFTSHRAEILATWLEAVADQPLESRWWYAPLGMQELAVEVSVGSFALPWINYPCADEVGRLQGCDAVARRWSQAARTSLDRFLIDPEAARAHRGIWLLDAAHGSGSSRTGDSEANRELVRTLAATLRAEGEAGAAAFLGRQGIGAKSKAL